MATAKNYLRKTQFINEELYQSCQQLKKQISVLKKETQRLTTETKRIMSTFPEMRDMILTDLTVCSKAFRQFRDCLNKFNHKNIIASLVKQAPYLIEKAQAIINALSNLANTIITIYQKFCALKDKIMPEIERTLEMAQQTFDDLLAVKDQITPIFEMAYEVIRSLMTSVSQDVKTFGNALIKDPTKKIHYLFKTKTRAPIKKSTARKVKQR